MQPLRTYRIETERLVIRCYKLEDAPAFLESITASREHLLPYMVWAAEQPTSLAERTDFLRKAIANYHSGMEAFMAIWDRTEKVFIGSTGYRSIVDNASAKIGYWVDVRQARKGYITETVAALTKVGFDIEGWNRLEIRHLPENVASGNIPRRLGYTYETTLKQCLPIVGGGMGDAMIWSLLKQDYHNLPIKHLAIRAWDVDGKRIAI